MTRLQIAADVFKTHPNQWVSALTFAQSCGWLSWRSRIAECRTLMGMSIENKVVRDRTDGTHPLTRSYYRYTPEVR